MAAREDERARARGSWQISIRSLRAGADEDLSGSTTAEERIAMMWPLAIAAWSLSGAPIDGYSRSQAPGRLLRGPSR